MIRILLLSLLALMGFVSPSAAHYNMLLPSTASAKKDEAVTFTYQWGHPFEHQLFDAPMPELVAVLAPDGTKSELTKTLEKITLSSGDKKVTAYRFTFKLEQRGDYVFVLRTPPIWMEEDGEYLQDTVKVVLHVQAQKGWDHQRARAFELAPLTRPYGLQPGMVFQARLVSEPALADTLIEIERYHEAAPKQLPPDEQITRTVKTDPNGVATCTLTDAGWWCLTAARPGGMKEHDGKNVPLRERSILWIYVDEKLAK